ncbi:HNH endonuclease signature motif containing protein [Modestobacter sp. VKM Ac-2986]|uniref:HNH endonuclease n=1 Tax=Modestobacter sp. VKM Ac-2986 TaxID=3004140 RepID=UPI0022AB43A4|nr:HNH endonuclease signature motif containing protein [Modestobacter sp. VKM Ac-2986]MCZ2828491.1 HNH endonuclease signature motif containing protein [Modestobacter sp. VKM Ac-2986]
MASNTATSSVLTSLWEGVWAQPWLGVLLALVVGRACLRVVREGIHGGRRRDPVRTYSRADKSLLLLRAGGRCEHHTPLIGRCEQTARLEADHVHPHSRGGSTTLANGQVLCRRHNKAKAARVPWNGELNRLARRRRSYAPPGLPVDVIRR